MDHYQRTVENYKVLTIEAEEMRRKLRLVDSGLSRANSKLCTHDAHGAHEVIKKLLEEIREDIQDPEELLPS